ncbi:NlpC/P60 family protein [Cupriavidus respiraculi]|uniref:NlpC/P60 domain-containing protein n=1 Tax=Cupriavidus respiraculi TaxID=195930 RepID=A0ABN7YGJ1_9BURK|nr:NlpC/P60 family protein [Cupriavidus respiraculi]CAG9171165.1 hypothetical protein LMG21510_01566 [Cupriavidus respiraculi]
MPTISRLDNPDRSELADDDGHWLATFTDGAYTVTLAGAERTFADAGDDTLFASVTHGVWVRTLPQPFDGNVDEAWLTDALAANQTGTPDVLAIAMQYVRHAPLLAQESLVIAGAARYGPPGRDDDDHVRPQEGADFNDYLGIPWTYPDEVDKPEAAQFRCLDCSGYMRMVWGYRQGLPLCLAPLPDGSAIPRRATQMCASAPGVMVIANEGAQATELAALRVGDLVFFDGDQRDGPAIDHVGMYLGLDDAGHHRFISSRKTADGPTQGDLGGKSILDGTTAHYAKRFRAARRL